MGLLSTIYKMALSSREFIYKTGFKKPQKPPATVISIGNLTLGGTGKTPAVIAVAQEAKKRGFKPCILTRGYRGRAKGPCFVSKGEGPLINASLAGDEPLLMAERLEDVPIVMGKDRYQSGIFAIQNLQSQIINHQSSIINHQSSILFILDDGFQHWALYRDMDILLIDATNPFGNGKLFPEGILREPLVSIKRADIIVITKVDSVCKELISAIIKKIKQYNPEAPIYTSWYKPTALINVHGETRGLDILNNKKVYAFAGIANPSYFKTILIANGANIVKFKTFRDHYFYKQRDINKMKEEAGGLKIITTEKDFVRLKRLELPENLFVLRIEFSIGDNFYDILFKKDV